MTIVELTEENEMHSILQEDVADEDEVEFGNKYEGDEINGDDIRSLNSILNENELEEDHRAFLKNLGFE